MTASAAAAMQDLLAPRNPSARRGSDSTVLTLTLAMLAPQVNQGDWRRFWSVVEVEGSGARDCWLWTGANRAGYGAFKLDGEVVGSHRLAHQWVKGPIPAGKVVDHLCGNRLCVRPDHLEVTTPTENVLRGSAPHFPVNAGFIDDIA